jgi:hypothetical protein
MRRPISVNTRTQSGQASDLLRPEQLNCKHTVTTVYLHRLGLFRPTGLAASACVGPLMLYPSVATTNARYWYRTEGFDVSSKESNRPSYLQQITKSEQRCQVYLILYKFHAIFQDATVACTFPRQSISTPTQNSYCWKNPLIIRANLLRDNKTCIFRN